MATGAWVSYGQANEPMCAFHALVVGSQSKSGGTQIRSGFWKKLWDAMLFFLALLLTKIVTRRDPFPGSSGWVVIVPCIFGV